MTKPSKNMTSHDKLCVAIGILQSKVMADDSAVNGEATFGVFYMPSVSVEHAVTLLTDIIPDLEHTDRENTDD